jgi:hypothetical protein|tara:strand:+ start:285 stop:479 length:195 start_codon:yes stop_codon:yes gene_type:complete
MSESTKYFRQKKGTWIWIYDTETNRRKKMELQLLLDRVNHTLRHENQVYFALEKERDIFRKQCK